MTKYKVGDNIKARSDCINDFQGGEGVITEVWGDEMKFRVTKESKHYEVGRLVPKHDWTPFIEITNQSYKPEAPTHVVIWEEDTDPAKLFTSELDAKKFIKELSDKSSVKKDSILLIEIKTCRKVNVTKHLGYKIHKI